MSGMRYSTTKGTSADIDSCTCKKLNLVYVRHTALTNLAEITKNRQINYDEKQFWIYKLPFFY